ncbi:MAG: hypothetical protein GXY85_08935 [Candidatus Brocadiaceae bacterium]|nr:hypothetical protein [Candidatus Brocadiaceae bacterium]
MTSSLVLTPVLLACLLLAAGCSATTGGPAARGAVLRVNCGATQPYTDERGVAWLPDQEWAPERGWGVQGGGNAPRCPDLPVPDVPARGLYFSERYGARHYRFGLPNGDYAVRLHFAETHAPVWQPGMRRFHVDVQGRRTLTAFDPFAEGNGFARPTVVEVRGVSVTDGELVVGFEADRESAAVNGIEILRTPPTEFGVRRLTDPAAYGPRAVPSCRDLAAAGRPVKVLFIGHSYTGWWALPQTIASLVNSGQSDIHLIVEDALRGGARMDYFVGQTDTLERIRSGGFDYVVQGSPGSPEAVETLHAAVRESGARSMLYCLWVGQETPPAEQEPSTREQLEVARKVGAVFVPVGPAWQAVRERRPDLQLHNIHDKHHPELAGSYLSACVFYAVLTGRSPVGIPCTATQAGQAPVDPETARFLQEVAWETVRGFAPAE